MLLTIITVLIRTFFVETFFEPWSKHYCVCMKNFNALQLSVFVFSFFVLTFFCQPYPGFWNCKSVFLILKTLHYGGSRRCIHVRNDIWTDIPISIRPMTTKFGKQAHLQDLTQMRLMKQVQVTWLRQNQWLTKNMLPLPKCLGLPNLAGCYLTLMGSCLQSQMTLWSRDITICYDKIKPLYLHYQSAFDYQTCQDGNLPSSACVYKITWPFDQVVLYDHVTNWNCFISTTTEPMATNLAKW